MEEKRQSGYANIELPSLNLESESDDEDGDNIEPIIFHPGLTKEPAIGKLLDTPSEKDVGIEDSGVNLEIHHDQNNVSTSTEPVLRPPPSQDKSTLPFELKVTTIQPPDITEIELDNALIEYENRDPNKVCISRQEPHSLSDSGSSGSSLMGKLEAVVSSLKDQEHTEDTIIDQAIEGPIKALSPKIKTTPQETVVIDLHTESMVHTNKCVVQRYSSCKEKDIDSFDLEREREDIKRQSLDIIQSHENLSVDEQETFHSETSDDKLQNTNEHSKPDQYRLVDENVVENKAIISNIPLQEIEYDEPNEKTVITSTMPADVLSCMSSTAMNKSIDEILQNANRIMYNMSDPGEDVSLDLVNHLGDVQTLYNKTLDDEVRTISEGDRKQKGCLEYVQEYIVFNENAGEATSPVHSDDSLVEENEPNFNNFTDSSTKKIETKPKTDILKNNKSKRTKTLVNNDTVSTNGVKRQTENQEEIFKAVHLFKKEVGVDISLENKEKVSSLNPKNTVRELMFSEDKVGTKNVLNSLMKDNNNKCLACLHLTADNLETPLKHDTKTCSHLNGKFYTHDEKPKAKETCSIGVTTDELHNYEATLTNEKENVPVDQQEDIALKSSKKKKKKKNKVQKEPINEDSTTANKKDQIAKQQQPPLIASKEKMTINDIHKVEQIIKELQELTGQQVFISSDVSFKDGYNLIPPVQNKQFLVLKIPLESPGICKGTNTSDMVNCVVDTNQFHNFLGLVSLFLFLLQSNASKYQLVFLDVPFDVVSLFQCSIEDELYLMVGICENDKTYLQKTKRTKLGSNFFHAVSQFIHANSLEKLLAKYLPSIPPIPACGKLSSFINIVPDENFLQKLSAIAPSSTVKSMSKQVKLSDDIELEAFPSEPLKQEYINVVFPHVNTGTTNVINEFIAFLYGKSYEVTGLKIGYIPLDGDPNAQQTVLAVCTQLNSKAIEFFGPKIPTQYLRTSSSVSNKELIQWFGPKFKDLNELKDLASGMKPNMKNSSVSKKKKWSAEISRLSFLCSSPSYVVLLVSSSVPSWAIPCIIAASKQTGVTLKNICRNTVSAEQLCGFGIFEGNSEHFGLSHLEWKKTVRNNKEVGSFTYLLLHGNSALIKLKNITENVTDLLNKTTVTDSQVMQCFEKIPNLSSLLKKRKSQVGSKLTSKDYFAVLRLNDQSVKFYAAYKDVPNAGVLDFYEKIVQYCHSIPAINLAFLVIYGEDLLAQLQKILEVCFLGSAVFSNQPEKSNARKTLLMQSLIGIKHLKSLQRHQAHDLINEDINSKQWKQMVSCLESQPAVIVLLKAEDERCLRELKDSLSSYVFSAKVDVYKNNIIVHSDSAYVFYLMLQYFHPYELRNDQGIDRRKISPVYLEDDHPLISDMDRLYNLKIIDNYATKKCICPSTPMPAGYESLHQKVVYELHPPSLSFPWEVLLRQEISYVGFSAKYAGNSLKIAKAVSRIVRMGFKIVGWKFPMFRQGGYWLNIVFSRADAIVMMEKIKAEIETSYPQLELCSPQNLNENLNFIKNFFRSDGYGGILDISYLTLINEIYFTQDAVFCSRSLRDIEWHPTHDAVYNYGLGFMTNNSRTFNSTNENLLEVTVLIVPIPLIRGVYMGKQLPRRCVFPELWQCFESVSYKMLASKMTSLSENEANDVVEHCGLEKRNKMKSFLTSVDEPFMVVILMGSCIQSNFWLDMERYFSKEEEEIETLKKHLWVASSKRQVEYLSTAMFDQVLPNGKIDIRTSMI